MNNIYDFSYFNRDVEIKTLEAALKKLYNDAIKESVKSYGPEYGPMMAVTKLNPIAHVYQERLETLRRQQLELGYETINKTHKNFIKQLFNLSRKRGL